MHKMGQVLGKQTIQCKWIFHMINYNLKTFQYFKYIDKSNSERIQSTLSLLKQGALKYLPPVVNESEHK